MPSMITERYYVLLRRGGSTDYVRCSPEEIDAVKDIMDAVIIGDGDTKEDAFKDARPRSC